MANDREHFESYREQTRAKHTILEKYIVAYFNILKGNNKNLVYIDGFAGRGFYTSPETGETVDGSPLRALKRIAAAPDLASRVTTVFIEKDAVLAADLKKSVDAFFANNRQIREPQLAVGTFAAELTGVLNGLDATGAKLAPTFLFVDPCGVAGASFDAIKRFMSNDSCELLLFFNIDGVRRILGLRDQMGETLADLLGSKERAADLLAAVERCAKPTDKEACIVAYYDALIRAETGAKFVTMFRVESEDRRATSHYLIHVAKHPMGFRIMKDVMWDVGQTDEGTGGLALEQASASGEPMLIRSRWERVKSHVLDVLRAGQQRVSHFYETLATEPENKLCEKAYRRALLELEKSGEVVVLAKDGSGTVAPKRRADTLAKDYFVRLALGAERSA